MSAESEVLTRPSCSCHAEPMNRNGTAWRCSVKNREGSRRWRLVNADKVREQDRQRSRAAGRTEFGSPEFHARLSATKSLPRKDIVGYEGAHRRVWTARGPAAALQCIDCGEPAQDWSLSWRRIPLERLLLQPDGRRAAGSPYSLAPSDYDPRCRSHARIYDREWGAT